MWGFLLFLQTLNDNSRSTASTIANTSSANLSFFVGQDTKKSGNDTSTAASKRMAHCDCTTKDVAKKCNDGLDILW
jgi:hypothetical protein